MKFLLKEKSIKEKDSIKQVKLVFESTTYFSSGNLELLFPERDIKNSDYQVGNTYDLTLSYDINGFEKKLIK